MRRGVAMLALLGVVGCGRPSQVIIDISAEDDLRADISTVEIRVWGRDADGTFVEDTFQNETAVTNLNESWLVDLQPRNGDSSRVWRVEATALGAGGTFLAVARASASYQPGESRIVYLKLYDQCRGVSCNDVNTTCTALGRCEEVPVSELFHPDGGRSVDAGRPMDAGEEVDAGRPMDAGEEVDAGMDAGPLDAGPCVPSPEVCNGLDDNCNGIIDEIFDLNTDVRHCGDCNNPCIGQNSTSSCSAGTCEYACSEGYLNCDVSQAGCETRVDSTHCGCGTECTGATPLCDESMLTCLNTCGDQTDCGGTCVDTTMSTAHCRGCNQPCEPPEHSVAVCTGTGCSFACDAGFGQCEEECKDFNSRENCGGCGVVCGGCESCIGGSCVGACPDAGPEAGVGIDDASSISMDAGSEAGMDAGEDEAGTPGDAGCGGVGMCGSACCDGGAVCCGGACCPGTCDAGLCSVTTPPT